MENEMIEINIPINKSNLDIIYLRNFDLSQYHHYSKYDENIFYEEYEFKNFGHGLLRYKKYILFNYATDEKYIAFIQDLSDIEIIALSSFCECPEHTNNIFKKLFFNKTPCYLQGLDVSQKFIDIVKEKYKRYYNY